MVEEAKQIIKNESRAYGYNYASLADIVRQGFELPAMETRCVDGTGKVFMGWLDEKGDWHQGTPVIVPEMRGMNAAQAMGAAITYARRFTAQMALGLACDDDAKLEKTKDSPGANNGVSKIDFKQVREEINKKNSLEDLVKYWMGLKLTEKQANVLKNAFAERKAKLENKDGVE